MAVTQVGAIYGTVSKLLQRVYVPHADDSEIARQHVEPTETLLHVPLEVYRSGGQHAVQQMIGTPTHDGHCEVIHKDTGEVIDRIIWDHTIWDPALYKHPEGHRIVPRK